MAAAAADDWAQWRGAGRDGVWSEEKALEKLPEGEMPVEWRVAVGSGYSGPTVADGRVYLMDKVTEPEERERVLCFAEDSGEALWTQAYDCKYSGIDYGFGPRASVLVAEGRAFSLGAMAHARAFDAASGEVHWERDLKADYGLSIPGWGIAGSPILAGGSLILQIGGEGGACVVGLEPASGKERWRALDDRASYSSPIVIGQAGKAVCVVWTADNLVGLNPGDGSVYWKVATKPRQYLDYVATPVFDAASHRIVIASFLDGTLVIQLGKETPTAELLWERVGINERKSDGLQPMIMTPIVLDGHIYGIDSYGESRCLRLSDGERLWEDKSIVPVARWASAFFIHNPVQEATWIFNELGELIVGEFSPEGFREWSRSKLIEPTTPAGQREGGKVCWMHPAFANGHVLARNDRELVRARVTKE